MRKEPIPIIKTTRRKNTSSRISMASNSKKNRRKMTIRLSNMRKAQLRRELLSVTWEAERQGRELKKTLNYCKTEFFY
jgi:hypothetical protein